jgi:hypothetical protein
MPTPKVNSWLGWRIFTVNSRPGPCGTTTKGRPGRLARAGPSTGSEPRRPVAMGTPTPSSVPRPLPSADYHPGASSSPNRSSTPARSRCRGSTSPEKGGTATSTSRIRCATPLAPPPLRTPGEIEAPDPSGPPPPAPGRQFAGIWPDRRRPVPGDDIARFVIFLGCFLWSKGMVVNLQKLPGASAQKETSIVFAVCRNL